MHGCKSNNLVWACFVCERSALYPKWPTALVKDHQSEGQAGLHGRSGFANASVSLFAAGSVLGVRVTPVRRWRAADSLKSSHMDPQPVLPVQTEKGVVRFALERIPIQQAGIIFSCRTPGLSWEILHPLILFVQIR